MGGAGKLDRQKPVVFHCNGPECWKSYKAAKVALSKGFKTVYWFRGGYPEWESRGLPIDSTAAAASATAPVPATSAPITAIAKSQ